MKVLGIAATLLLAACAAPAVPPDDALAAAMAAIEDAQRAGAAEYAPAELNEARDKLAEAHTAVQRKDFDFAKRLAEATEIDARLAQARAHTQRAERDLAALNESIKAMRRK
jgi:hypothetical protein